MRTTKTVMLFLRTSAVTIGKTRRSALLPFLERKLSLLRAQSPGGNACNQAWSLSEYGRLYNWFAVDDARSLIPAVGMFRQMKSGLF